MSRSDRRRRLIRQRSKPSTAKCDLHTYTGYLIVEPKYSGCCRLTEMFSEMSHDSINRFRERERYDPKDLFTEIKGAIEPSGGTLSGDDTIVEKLYSDLDKTELIGYYWSGKHKKTIKGINLITLYYTDGKGSSFPVNYRLYNLAEGKTKNDYLREMVEEVIEWGIKPINITTDGWYSSRKNLKLFRDKGLEFLVGIAKNRSVKVEGGQYVRVENLDIPPEGKVVTLKQFGIVKVFNRLQERYEDAEPLYQQALNIVERKSGSNHPDAIIIRENLEFVRQKKKDF